MVDMTAPETDLKLTSIEDAISHLKEQFPDAVSSDTRDGYNGVIVQKDKLRQVAQYVHDQLGFDYLSSATAVDYLGEGNHSTDHLEMVYHAYRTTGGSALVFKAQTDRNQAEVPSLVPVWRGADFQEREAWDLYGIKFTDHPNLQRILLWEGFHGFPMRKDWKEAYFEEDFKPFSSRWPSGHVHRAEEKNIFGKNVRYPADIDLARLSDASDTKLYENFGVGVDTVRLRCKQPSCLLALALLV